MADKKSKPPFYLIDTQSAFYKPLGRRLAICLSTIAWAALESWHRDPFWSVIAIACAVYCVYVLFWTYKPPMDPPPRPPDPDEDGDEATEVKAAETAVTDIEGEEKPKS